MNHHRDPLDERLTADARAFRPEAPIDLAARVLEAARTDTAARPLPRLRRRRWPLLVMPLAACLALGLLLAVLRPGPARPNRTEPELPEVHVQDLKVHAYLDLVFSAEDGTPAPWQRRLAQPFPNELEILRDSAGEESILGLFSPAKAERKENG